MIYKKIWLSLISIYPALTQLQIPDTWAIIYQCKNSRYECFSDKPGQLQCAPLNVWVPCVIKTQNKRDTGIICAASYMDFDKNECRRIDRRVLDNEIK